jgi:Rrf2 family nitric oxide-sensitive transcriptional repressor
VVRHTEPDMALVPCLKPVDASCAIKPCCGLRRALERAGAAFIEVLDGYSLADLVKPRAPLRNLLAIEPISLPHGAPRKRSASRARA